MKKLNETVATPKGKGKATSTPKSRKKNVANEIIDETTEITATTEVTEVTKEKKEAKPRQTAAEKQAELEQAICKQWNISEADLLRYSLKNKKQKQTPIEFFERLIVNLVLGKASFE